jgi:hypothetical protein
MCEESGRGERVEVSMSISRLLAIVVGRPLGGFLSPPLPLMITTREMKRSRRYITLTIQKTQTSSTAAETDRSTTRPPQYRTRRGGQKNNVGPLQT